MPLSCFHNKKGMITVLIWSFSAWILVTLVASEINSPFLLHKYNYIILPIIGSIFPFVPMFGWIADAYCGRYKIMHQCLQVQWLASIAFCMLPIIPDSLPHAVTIKYTVDTIIVVILLFSLAGLQVNILQFGVDQLPDASSADITAFTNWYTWVGCLGYITAKFSTDCICSKYTAVAKLLLPACTTLALCLDYNFNHWLIKEPASENPLKLIYRVMCYAWKNKYPRQRSAFTYCDDKRYSRIDFAKQKFGGPFSTEKVENVKTFWRILFYFAVFFIYAGFIINILTVSVKMEYHIQTIQQESRNTPCSTGDITKCLQKNLIYNFGYLVVAIVIPLHEFLLHRLIGRLTSFTKFITGLLLSLLSTIGYLALEVAGHIKLHDDITNVTCLLEVKESDYSTWNSLPVDYKWTMLPESLHAFGNIFMLVGVIQFICAQSPYSMKGLILGIAYGLFGLSIIISYVIMLPITSTVHKWPPNRYGCGTWYLLSASIVLLIMFIIACLLSWRYKKRQRGDVLPNEQVFAINYYTRYIMYNAVES